MFEKDKYEKAYNYIQKYKASVKAHRYGQIYKKLNYEEKRYATYIFKEMGLLDDIINRPKTFHFGMFRDYDIPEKFDLPKKFVIKGCVYIANGAFAGNSTVEEIVINKYPYSSTIDGNVYEIEELELSQYAPAKKDECFTVPNTVTCIEQNAFRDNQFLKKVIIPDNVKAIAEYAFENCEKLEEVILPKTKINIASKAFSNCKALKQITIPDNTRGGMFIFENCVSLEKVVIGKNVVTDNWTFKNCTALKDVELGENYEDPIGTFENCTSLTEIKLAKGQKVLFTSNFVNCSNLKTFILPKTIQKIDRTDEKLTSLENIYFEGTKEEFEKIKIVSYSKSDSEIADFKKVFYYAEDDGKTTEKGHYWFYDANGHIVTWQID